MTAMHNNNKYPFASGFFAIEPIGSIGSRHTEGTTNKLLDRLYKILKMVYTTPNVHQTANGQSNSNYSSGAGVSVPLCHKFQHAAEQ